MTPCFGPLCRPLRACCLEKCEESLVINGDSPREHHITEQPLLQARLVATPVLLYQSFLPVPDKDLDTGIYQMQIALNFFSPVIINFGAIKCQS